MPPGWLHSAKCRWHRGEVPRRWKHRGPSPRCCRTLVGVHPPCVGILMEISNSQHNLFSKFPAICELSAKDCSFVAYGWSLKALQQLGVHPCITHVPQRHPGISNVRSLLQSTGFAFSMSPPDIPTLPLSVSAKILWKSMQRCLAVGVQAGTAALVPCPQGCP